MTEKDQPPAILSRVYDAEKKRPPADPDRLARVLGGARASAAIGAAVTQAALVSGAAGVGLGLLLGFLAFHSDAPPIPPLEHAGSAPTVDASTDDAGVVQRTLADAATVRSAEPTMEPASPITEPAPPTRPRGDHDTALAEERRLVDTMREALARSDAASCLSVAEAHARRFPVGALAEERSALRTRALAMLGRHAEAEAALARFSAEFPESPLRGSLAREIGGEVNGSGSDEPIHP